MVLQNGGIQPLHYMGHQSRKPQILVLCLEITGCETSCNRQ